MPFYANTTYKNSFDPRETKYKVPELENLPHKFYFNKKFFINDIILEAHCLNTYLSKKSVKLNKNIFLINRKKLILSINSHQLNIKKFIIFKQKNFFINFKV